MSYLVRQLAEELTGKADFEEYYVSCFRSREDLTDVFRAIGETNTKGNMPFVLLDEVDSEVEGNYVFNDLLAPMWDGRYYVGPKKHPLGKAVFFFTASELLLAPSIEDVLGLSTKTVTYAEFAGRWRQKVRQDLQRAKTRKLRDFIDRMDLLLCVPPLHPLIGDGDVAAEMAQLVCVMIRKYHPSIQRVEKSAAWALMSLVARASSRRIAESDVFMSANPEDNAFLFSHLPRKSRERHEQDSIADSLHGSFFTIP